MEDRKRRRQSVEVKEKEVKQSKATNTMKSSSKLMFISKVLTILLAISIIAVFGMVIYLKVLPNKYLIPLCIAVVALIGGVIFICFRKKISNVIRLVISVLSVILIAIFSFVGLKLVKTMDFLGNMTTETVNAKTYSVVVMKDGKYTKLEDIQYRLLLYYDNELNQNQQSINKLTEVMTVVTEKTDDIHELATRLVKNEVDAILIEDSYYSIIEEEMEDFRQKTTAIYTFTLEDVIQTIAKDVSVTKEPFNVYISGIDAYGKISSVARSDVNMVVSVNPQTKQVLLVNIPRDYYVKLNGTYGYRDKLTHAGIYGIDMSVKTIEDLFDIDINYYVRVNFTSLIDIIDAIGGVNVYSEYDFTSRIGKYKFKKGYNQMNGKQALGFARERYSFAEGDRMRGQNQQAVIDAVIKKVCSSSTILTKFDALLDSLEGSFQTNMDYTKMVELVRMQISDNAQWNVTSIGVDGLGSTERTYSMGKTLLYVMIPYAGSVNIAESMINSVLDGEVLKSGHIDISEYNDYPVVSRGVYETEKDKDEDKNKDKETEKEEQKPEENPSEGTGDSTGNTGNAGGSTEGSGNTGDSTEGSGNAGGSTEDSGNTGDSTENSGNAGGSAEDSGNAGGSTEDSGNAGGSTEDSGNAGDSTEDSGNAGGSTEGSGNTGDSTGNSGNAGGSTEDSGNAGDNTESTGNTGDSTENSEENTNT